MSEAWDRQTLPKEGSPHGWIQWKGTDVCMDVHCVCGFHSHIDTDFCYWVKCPACEAVYFCNGHIELVPATEEEANSHTGVKLAVAEPGELEHWRATGEML